MSKIISLNLVLIVKNNKRGRKKQALNNLGNKDLHLRCSIQCLCGPIYTAPFYYKLAVPNKSAKPKELKLIQCKARICTSFVRVIPQVIDFGDTNVGTQESFQIQILNQSDICAHVELVFEFRILNCTQAELLNQPKSTVGNLPTQSANFLEFGPIRTCTLVSIRDASLLFGIATYSQQEIVIYTKNKNKSSALLSTETELKKHGITPFVTDALLYKKCRTRLTNVQYNSTAYLDFATVPHETFSPFKHKRNMVSRMTFTSKAPLNNNKNQSETYNLKKKLNNSLKIVADGSILKTTTKEIIPTSNHKSRTFIAQHKRYKKKKQQSRVGITYRNHNNSLKKVREKTMGWPDIAGKFRVPLDDLISIIEHGSLSRTSLFARQSLEEQFVRYQLARRTKLARLIEKKK
ncbi:hypothetical protein EDC94DRAFT_653837 [Helicostylum pulchrum]|nr:hypothetical protein EDC94DRAFT_653837 [Helicostylum pulchrum]